MFFIIMSSSLICLFFGLLSVAVVVVAYRSVENDLSGDVETFQKEPSATTVIHRKKRYLDFIPLSRVFVINNLIINA